MSRKIIEICLLLALLPPIAAAALESDRRQPIQVQADRVELDNRHGVTTYSGHVVLDQGSLHLEAETLVARRKGDTLERIEAEGSPVRFRERDEKTGREIQGSAQHIDYRADSGLLILQGTAQIQRGDDHVSSERIEYDAHRGVVTASGGAGGNRVHAVIRPKQAPNAGAGDKPK